MMNRQKVELGQLKHSVYVIRLLAKRDRSRGNSSAFLGQLWQILNPFIYMVVMALLFTNMFTNDNFMYYPIFILTGTMIDTLFAEGTFNCLTALSANKNFLINSSISRKLYPVERVYVAFVNFLFSTLIFFLVAWYFQLKPSWTWILVIPNIIMFVFLVLGIGKILAIINVYFADITYFYKIFRLFVFYASAIFYDTARLSPSMQKLISLNPVYVSIALARISLIDKVVPSISLWIKLFVYSMGIYLLGTYIYNKNISNIIEKI